MKTWWKTVLQNDVPIWEHCRITGHFLTTININVENLYYRIVCCHSFHCFCRQGCNHFLGEGVGGVRTPNFFIPPQFWTAFNVGDRFNSFVLNVFLFSLKSQFFQDFSFNYTPDWTIWSSKFRQFSGGLTEPPPQTHPSLFLRLRPQFPEKIEPFSVIIWTATDWNVEFIVCRHKAVNDNDVTLIFVVVFGIIIIVVVVIINIIPRKITIIGHPCCMHVPIWELQDILKKSSQISESIILSLALFRLPQSVSTTFPPNKWR